MLIQVPSPPGKSWNLFCKISQTWKLLENDFGAEIVQPVFRDSVFCNVTLKFSTRYTIMEIHSFTN